MKNGLIIYYKDEGEKNKKFIEMLIDYGKEEGINLRFISREKLFLNGADYEPVDEKSFKIKELDLVINRTRDYRISEYFEKLGIKAYNDSFMVKLCNDKYETYEYVRKKADGILKDSSVNSYENKSMQVRIPKSYLIDREIIGEEVVRDYNSFINYIKDYVESLGVNKAVIKSVDGHGGTEVFLVDLERMDVNNPGPDIKKVSNILKSGRKLVIQEFIESDGRDLRVYVMNNEIYAAVLRKSKDGFKSNYSRGGEVALYDLGLEGKDLINQVIKCFSKHLYGFIGIDFLMSKDGALIFNEVEEMCGARMLYSVSNKDIARDMIKVLI
ncbi:MAG: ATP-grasp domain-containing protein [Lachnospiraceae bacterium]|nr:ATP-grasp domain-containing protein [Lachnospiraceae bacterium]